jgi:hypothetical protein
VYALGLEQHETASESIRVLAYQIEHPSPEDWSSTR